MDVYPATYSDANGAESTTIANDGTLLRMSVRGTAFVGPDFDMFEPSNDTSPSDLRSFSINHGCLSSCRITWRMPVRLDAFGHDEEGTLAVDLLLGDPTPTGFLDREELRVVLEFQDQRFASPGNTGYFEDELLGLWKQLPSGLLMKACINCLYSDYSPAGNGLFGSMMCFRNCKAEYLAVRSKHQMWALKCDRMVQETFLCPEFERRIPGTGYRG
jgi:hypothetical protein